eukprot:3941216-Rhodomonas_salina.5
MPKTDSCYAPCPIILRLSYALSATEVDRRLGVHDCQIKYQHSNSAFLGQIASSSATTRTCSRLGRTTARRS